VTEALWVALVGLLAVPVSLVIGWLVNRKKNISDIYKNITDQSVAAAGGAVEAMQTAMETLSHELATASSKIEQLSKEIVELRHQNLLLLRENHSLHAKIDELVVMVGHTGEFDPLPADPSSDPAS
jgi:chromosome segregation ATPase